MLTELTAHLATRYDTGAHSALTREEATVLRQWIGRQSRAIPVPVRFAPIEITLSESISHLRNSGVLVISVLHSSHPVLTKTEIAWFRAVHDWQHVLAGSDDTLSGEIAAYNVARSTAPQGIWWILFSEIVLQSAAAIHHGEFQAQKLVRV